MRKPLEYVMRQVLCKSFPSEFISYFHYCRSLRFEDKPDYSYLKKLFHDLFIREGWSKYCVFSYFRWLFFDFLILQCESGLNLLYTKSASKCCRRVSAWLCVWLDHTKVSPNGGEPSNTGMFYSFLSVPSFHLSLYVSKNQFLSATYW